jgi:glutamate decarboxylase
MDTDKLQCNINEQLELGNIPLIVIATSGSTVLGSYDPLIKIGNICNQYNIWFHVDASYGGTVILSSKYKYLLEGINKADSISWNPHKMLRVPLQCSLLLFKDKSISINCNKLDASYLFQSDKAYDIEYDTGKKYLQCGRKVDILKLWTIWKIRGEQQINNDIETIFNIASTFRNKIKDHPNFRLVIDNPFHVSTNICFWLIPNNNIPINDIAPLIKKKMLYTGKILISYQPLESMNLPNFFRIVFINPSLTNNDIDNIINILLELCNDI